MEITEKPKRPLNAWFRFRKDHYKEFVLEHKDMKVTEITSELMKKFAMCPPEVKQKYESEFKQEMEKWKKDIAEWK